MKQFNTSDAEGIKEYIKSLDVYNQFDEIIVDLLRRDSIDDDRIHEVRIKIKSLDRVIYRLQRHRNFLKKSSNLTNSLRTISRIFQLQHFSFED